MRLFHYTCVDHGEPGIRAEKLLQPNPHPWLPVPLVWLTDLDVAHRSALGLTGVLVRCDRSAVRFEVHPDDVARCQRWLVWARQRIDRAHREAFDYEPGAMPMHWWVSEVPLRVRVP